MGISNQWSWSDLLPVFSMGLMGLSLLAYVILDGYVLGIGILTRYVTEEEKGILIDTVAPYWDANQTWLVLGASLLTACFPWAQGMIFGSLYIPIFIMIIGLILRGVAFEFRVKAAERYRPAWNNCFYIASVIISFSQGVMLGQYVTGLHPSFIATVFSFLTGFCLIAGHVLLGSSWLILKSSGSVRKKAIFWAKNGIWGTALGVFAISLATPAASITLFRKWFSFPNIILLSPIPFMTVSVFLFIYVQLQRLSRDDLNTHPSLPLVGTMFIFFLAFMGLAYSMFPYLVIDRITVWQAAAAPQSLNIIFIGAILILPIISLYTMYVHIVFSRKISKLP
ncbi:cytochrome d ubiquinol oxidase subunit II [Candidatus Ichthyocystis hellenicum]|uniref:cytochrome d ubiquinol oxidase subunit II n=1 Tax=Candidatus Ichthyocystis hellenicum TaxID=1561003 RepID=UPI000A8A320A|nr:cytochrome d ubiquinol oxidase subunit II [Candidatus Ichthyocystis hellenicum]